MANQIPIENLYYLFCYAWDYFPEGKSVAVDFTACKSLNDLFAYILIRGTKRVLRKGLDRGYLEHEEELRTVRGRILIAETATRDLLTNGQIACRFDELSHDVLHNQIIRSTMLTLSLSSEIDRSLRHELRELCRRMSDVSCIRISSQCFQRVQLSRSNRQYGLLLSICKLLHLSRLPTQSSGSSRFGNVLDDEIRMSTIFEQFVRNFFRHEQSEFSSVGSEVIPWGLEALDPAHAAYLPRMITDVTLRSPERTIVIDTKFYKQTLSNYRGEKVWSSHLYQLFAYLSNLERQQGTMQRLEGVLLYPAVGKRLELRYTGTDHDISVFTLNLDQHWSLIRRELLAVLNPSSG